MEQEDREMRDRVVRLEANLDNLKDSHNVTKSEFSQFKKEMLEKFDELSRDVKGIEMTMAKYLGGFSVLFVIAQIVVKFIFK